MLPNIYARGCKVANTNRFNLESYQQWLIDIRDNKLETLGI
jgi:hypothetical protein